MIPGAGHTGLEIAARVKYLGVRALIIEKKPRIRDAVRRLLLVVTFGNVQVFLGSVER